MKNYIVVDKSEAMEDGQLKEGYEKRAYCYVKLVPIEESYKEKRLRIIPSIGDQLDMIYWDKVNGTNLWQEMINKIKTDFPKEQ